MINLDSIVICKTTYFKICCCINNGIVAIYSRKNKNILIAVLIETTIGLFLCAISHCGNFYQGM